MYRHEYVVSHNIEKILENEKQFSYGNEPNSFSLQHNQFITGRNYEMGCITVPVQLCNNDGSSNITQI